MSAAPEAEAFLWETPREVSTGSGSGPGSADRLEGQAAAGGVPAGWQEPTGLGTPADMEKDPRARSRFPSRLHAVEAYTAYTRPRPPKAWTSRADWMRLIPDMVDSCDRG
ncbi:hypothetical protein LBMAG53_26160 [Planctomycetota bacterium]|nr:hypothetical protein LBMAG53_26160 [Planctomycetota bacterium]